MPMQTPKDVIFDMVNMLPDAPVGMAADAPTLQLPQPPQLPQLPQLPTLPQPPQLPQPKGNIAMQSDGYYDDDDYYDDVGMYADDIYIDDPGQASLYELQESEPEYYAQADIGGWTPRDDDVIINTDDEVIGGWISRD